VKWFNTSWIQCVFASMDGDCRYLFSNSDTHRISELPVGSAFYQLDVHLTIVIDSTQRCTLTLKPNKIGHRRGGQDRVSLEWYLDEMIKGDDRYLWRPKSGISENQNLFPKMDPLHLEFFTFSRYIANDYFTIFHHGWKHWLMWPCGHDISKTCSAIQVNILYLFHSHWSFRF